MFNLGLNNIKKLWIDYSESRNRVERIKNHFNLNELRRVRISVRNNTFNQFIKLQTPGQLGVWGKTAFLSLLNPDLNVVINKQNPYLKLSGDISKNWLLHIEPPGYIKRLGLGDAKATKDFGRVYTSDPSLFERGGKFVASPPFVHWHLAVNSYVHGTEANQYDYDFLLSQGNMPVKDTDMVAINSSMNDLPGHKQRAEFIKRLCENNFDFDLHGSTDWSKFKQYKGRALEGKWPVYSKSRYVLVIENEVADYYWSEKFTDAILCYAMPIYYGSPKIGDYFPKGSYIPLDITKPSAIDDLRSIVSSDHFERNQTSLAEARNLILKKLNMFGFIDEQLMSASL
jgi:hypothetical protein